MGALWSSLVGVLGLMGALWSSLVGVLGLMGALWSSIVGFCQLSGGSYCMAAWVHCGAVLWVFLSCCGSFFAAAG